jgi:hypothetical protein
MAAATASLLLAGVAIAYLLLGPIYRSGGGDCSSGGACVTYSGTKPLTWNSILLIPIAAAGLVLAGVALSRRTRLSEALLGTGCLGLAVITFLGVFSVGMFLLPADAAAGLALTWIRQAKAPNNLTG